MMTFPHQRGSTLLLSVHKHLKHCGLRRQITYLPKSTMVQQEINNSLLKIKNLKTISSNRNASAGTKETLPVDAVLSDTNKLRVQEHLKNVRPVWDFSRSKSTGSQKKIPYAGVLVPLCTVQGQPSLLFTVRTRDLSTHKGQVSFPGGKADQSDKDIIHTSLREAEEEIGLTGENIQVWGQLPPLPSRQDNSLRVIPVICTCGEVDISKLRPNKNEVESVFTRTLESLCHPDNTQYTRFRSGRGYTLPVYIGGEHRIWGLTAIIVHQCLSILAPGTYNLKLKQ